MTPDESTGLSTAQQQLWTGQRMAPDSPMYNMAVALELQEELDVDAFRRAFARLVAGCDALRTTFQEVDGRVVRRVSPPGNDTLEYHDLTGTRGAADTLPVDLAERTRRVLRGPGPLFDTALFKLDHGRFVWYLNQHHLTTDAWSTSLLVTRLGQLYRQATEATPPVDTDWPGYEEFLQHEQARLDSGHGRRAREHWTRVSEAPRTPQSFYGRVNPARHGRSRRYRLDVRRHTDAVGRLAQRPELRSWNSDVARLHVFTTWLLAFLHRVGDQRDVRVSLPSHNRGTARLREAVGALIELFPIDVTVDPGDSFATLARRVAQANHERLIHAVPGTSGFAPKSEVVLNVIKGSLGPFADVPTSVSWIHSGHVDPDHALRMQVYDFGGTEGTVVELDLHADVFDALEARWAVRHLGHLLDAFVADPTQPVSAPDLVTPDEMVEIRGRPNDTPQPVPADLDGLLSDGLERDPEAVCVRRDDDHLSYGRVFSAARAWGDRLRRAVSTPAPRIGICLPRSGELIVSILAAIESHSTFVPIDPAHPDARASFVVGDAGLTHVVTSPALSDRVRSWGVEPLVIDLTTEPDLEPNPRPRRPPCDDTDDATPAYILYTSGSTGRPKGVVVPRSALRHYLGWARDQYTADGPTDFALFTSPAFDLTITALLVPLTCGGAVVVYPGDGDDDAFLVRRVLEDDRADVVKLTPSHLALGHDLLPACSRLRRLVLGGEDLRRQLAQAAFDALGGRCIVYNEYGPTEATVGCTIHRFDPATDTGASVPIGRPIDGMDVLVLNEHRHRCPRGVTGEIAVAGPSLALGYLGRETLTRDRFIDDPTRPGRTLYLTGDRGRWNASGELEFHGRQDLQVKWRGARIELAEIERALLEHPDVRHAAASLAHDVMDTLREVERCRQCGLEARHPDARLGTDGVCQVCRGFERARDHVSRYFGTLDDLREILVDGAARATGPHDCLVLFSGGKDSTYALCQLVDMGARPLVFHLDNGYISDQAKANIRRVVDMLGLELITGSTPAMPAIFADSLRRFSNVCNGCFKTLYSLATTEAHARGIPLVITGLSRGQLFETRLADLYRRGVIDRQAIDDTILEARKVYHRMDDEVSRSLDVELFRGDEIFETVQFVDFYRYCDVSLDHVLEYLGTRTPWIRPRDTGRSTNCRINDVGIFVHTAERGFHNYSLPYSWDVRLGHKDRADAVAELNDRIDIDAVRQMLDEVGYRETPHAERIRASGASRLIAHYVADREIPLDELRRFLGDRLPREAIPAWLIPLDQLPLTENGKLDRAALRAELTAAPEQTAYVAPVTQVEQRLAQVWATTLGVARVGSQDNFFELGGDSMRCLQIVRAADEEGLHITPRQVFDHPTLAELARVASPAAPRPTTTPLTPATATDTELAAVQKELDELDE